MPTAIQTTAGFAGIALAVTLGKWAYSGFAEPVPWDQLAIAYAIACHWSWVALKAFFPEIAARLVAASKPQA